MKCAWSNKVLALLAGLFSGEADMGGDLWERCLLKHYFIKSVELGS